MKYTLLAIGLKSWNDSFRVRIVSSEKNENLQKWALIAEVIAAVTVVVSLIFVGIQVRHSAEESKQNAEATRAATAHQTKRSFLDLLLMMSTNAELHAAWEKAVNEGYDSLNFHEQTVPNSQVRAAFHINSDSYYQYRNGTLDQEQWDPIMRSIDGWVENASFFWQVWDGWEHIFDDPFREIIESKRPSE